MSIFKALRLAVFSVLLSYFPLAQADLHEFALSGYCKGKGITLLQSQTIFPPANFDLKELNPEAVEDLYKNNVASVSLQFQCARVVLKSPEEIEAGFKNKPKGVVDIFTDEAWVGLREKYPGTSGILKLSQVGYSKDHTYAILYMSSSCDSLCGYADFFQYKFINGSWVFDKRVFVARS